MQRLGAKALVWSALALLSAGAVGGTGCTAKQPTELVPGVSTQMVVPKDLTGVTVEVLANGARVFCRQYQVSPGTNVVNLPSTLGVIPAQSPNTEVTITIRGYDATGATGGDMHNGGDFAGCSGVAVGGGSTPSTDSPRILRRSIQTYVDGHTLFLPMPLSYSCQDKDCSMMSGSTCAGNQCVPATTQAATLVDFDPTLLDGKGLCFSPRECFGDVAPAVLIDEASCLYGLPSWDSFAMMGANVQVYYQDWQWKQNTAINGMPYEQVVSNAGEMEILNEDAPGCGTAGKPPCEGFTVVTGTDAGVAPEASMMNDAGLPYSSAGPRIKLAPGLCDLVRTGLHPPLAPATGAPRYHTISDVHIGTLCAPKQPLLPICAMERNNNAVLSDAGTTGDGVCNVGVPLTPAPSVLYMVMDDTSVMHGAFGVGGSLTLLATSFDDPVFKRTYAGFKYVTANDSECTSNTTGYTVPAVPPCMPTTQSPSCKFDLAASVQQQVGTALATWAVPAAEIPAGTPVVCYGDADCPSAAPYCSKPNPALPEGGAPDAGEDAGDAGLTPGTCVTPKSLDLQAAMRLDVGVYAQVLSVAAPLPPPGVAGVMFFVNRVPQTALGTATTGDGGAPEAGTSDGGEGGTSVPLLPSPVAAQDCPAAPPNVSITTGTPGDTTTFSAEALAAQRVIESEALNAFNNTGQSLQTYFVVLGNDRSDTSAYNFFNQVQTDLTQANGAQPVITLNASNVKSGDQKQLLDFSNVIVKLGTCLYEVPQNISAATTAPSEVLIQYTNPQPPGVVLPPGANPPVTIPADSTCNANAALSDAGTANGWAFDNGRIRICGAACDGLRSAVQKADGIHLAFGVQAPDVPVSITPLCTGTSGSSDATTGGGG